jgi:uncharacterized protein YktB (UPF0637 family)
MKLDVNQVIGDMFAAMKNSIQKDGGKAKRLTDELLQNQKERLELYAELRINNEITQEQFESRLEDNKQIMKAELQAAIVISKVAAQNATNAAIEVFNKAVKSAISIVS